MHSSINLGSRDSRLTGAWLAFATTIALTLFQETASASSCMDILQLARAPTHLELLKPAQSPSIQDLVLEFPREFEDMVENGYIGVSQLKASIVMTARSRLTNRVLHFVFIQELTETGEKILLPTVVLSKKTLFTHTKNLFDDGVAGFKKLTLKHWGRFNDIPFQKEGFLFDTHDGGLLRFSRGEEGVRYGAGPYQVQIIPREELDLARLFETGED